MSLVTAFACPSTKIALRIWATLAVWSLAGGFSLSHVEAQASPYCMKVKARARSEAAVMFAPRLHLQALRNPSLVDLGPQIVKNFQLRAGASFSLLDAVRGARTIALSDADCAVQKAHEAGRRLVTSPLDALLVEAYRAQVRSFRASSGERENLLKRSQERLRQKLITVLEFHEIERIADELRQKQEVALGALSRLEAEGIELPPKGLDALVHTYVESSTVYEKKARSLRALDPWTFRVAGGAIPSLEDRVDWYGWLEVSYSLGGLVRAKHEDRYEEARRAEIESARYELPAKVRLLAQQVTARLTEAEAELALTNKSLKFIDDTLRSLGTSALPNVGHPRDALALQRMMTAAEQAYLQTLVDTLAPFRSN